MLYLRVRQWLSGVWWGTLGRFGLDHDRWAVLPNWQRRAFRACVIGLILVVIFAPIFGFDYTAYAAFAVFCLLYIPSWGNVRKVGRFLVPAGVLGIAIAFPYYANPPTKMFTIPIFGVWPDVHTGVTMLVFVMMALGLNVVVGYAGLLDLGYVAFYAMGAYMCAWFTSQQFAGQNPDGSPKRIIHFGAVGIDPKLGGFHITIWLLLAAAGIATAIIGIIIGLPTLRLRGDYLAIVTLGFGEIMPQVARNGDN